MQWVSVASHPHGPVSPALAVCAAAEALSYGDPAASLPWLLSPAAQKLDADEAERRLRVKQSADQVAAKHLAQMREREEAEEAQRREDEVRLSLKAFYTQGWQGVPNVHGSPC